MKTNSLIVAAPKLGDEEGQQSAFDVTFSILRDNRQADGLRKLVTIAASRNNAFYASDKGTTQDLHNAAFKSETIPAEIDISSWVASNDRIPRLLSVHLHFLSMEKVATFEGEIIQLLQDRPSAAIVDKETKTLRKIDSVCKTKKTVRIQLPRAVHAVHYIPRGSTGSLAPAGEPFDSKDECDLTVTVTATLPAGCVGNFDENDPLWPSHAIEKRSGFLMHAEKAHIFPHNKCVKVRQKHGKKIKVTTNYEWLNDPAEADFNFLYLSAGMHLSFDGSGRGRGTTTSTQATICIEPLARTVEDETGVKRFKIEHKDGAYWAKIPLRVWCRSESVAKQIKSYLTDGHETGFDDSTGLHYFENISVECLHRSISMGQEELLDGDTKERVPVYNKLVPFMDKQLSGAWSLTSKGYISSTEVMEKCLLWAANETWNNEWEGTVTGRTFESQTD